MITCMAYNNGRPFSTYDKDNIINDTSSTNCAGNHTINPSYGNGGGWWFGACSHSVLTKPHPNIYWYTISSTINYVEMKIRPKQCAI